jgi:hypothetical protein
MKPLGAKESNAKEALIDLRGKHSHGSARAKKQYKRIMSRQRRTKREDE